MPMDGLTIHYIVRELNEALAGGRLDKIAQPEGDELQFTIRIRGKNQVLLISANAGGTARIHLTEGRKAGPQEPPMFCMLVRKHLLGARLMEIRQMGGDRILSIVFEGLDELGYAAQKTLYLEIMGRHSNIILTGADGRILDSIKHVGEDKSRIREVLPGLAYAYPPPQDRIDPRGLDAETLEALLSQGDGAAALSASEVADAVGTSRVTARRYLQYLADEGRVARAQRLGGSGRPEVTFAWRR